MPKLDAQAICNLCDSIKKDTQFGNIGHETELKARDLLRQIVSWRNGYDVIVACYQTSP